jgi:hypothetical protein
LNVPPRSFSATVFVVPPRVIARPARLWTFVMRWDAPLVKVTVISSVPEEAAVTASSPKELVSTTIDGPAAASMSACSMPAPATTVPSRAIVPDWAPVTFETMLRPPATARVSKPSAPPSTVPETEPEGSNEKRSRLSAAPRRFSMSRNDTPATVPASRDAIDHVVSADGPASVSTPPAPSTETGMPMPSSEASIQKVSLRAPPTISIAAMVSSSRDWESPSTATMTLEPSREIVTSWPEEPGRCRAHVFGRDPTPPGLPPEA